MTPTSARTSSASAAHGLHSNMTRRPGARPQGGVAMRKRVKNTQPARGNDEVALGGSSSCAAALRHSAANLLNNINIGDMLAITMRNSNRCAQPHAAIIIRRIPLCILKCF